MYTVGSELPMTLKQQHIVTVTPRSDEEIHPICFTPSSAKTFPGLTTVDTPVSSKFQMFWRDIVPSLIRMFFNLQKKALTAGRLNSIDRVRLVNSGLQRHRFPILLQNPRSQSSPEASFSLQMLNMEILFALGKSKGQLPCLQLCQTVKHF